MKKILKSITLALSICIVVSSFRSYGAVKSGDQGEHPVQWDFSTKKLDGNTYEIRVVANIRPMWHIYAQITNPELGKPTTLVFKRNPLVEMVGTPKEIGNLIEQTEGNAKIRFYQERVEFIQTVKTKPGVKADLNLLLNVEFMACSDINGQCLAPDNESFDIKLD